jgi:microcystin degradation protein MlrC
MLRIGIAGLLHETNTFALEQNAPTDIVFRRGEQVLAEAHPRSFIGGFREAAQQPGVELVPSVEARFRNGGTIQTATFERCRDEIVGALAAAGHLDGVYFALHGAEQHQPPHRRLRARPGGGRAAAAHPARGDSAGQPARRGPDHRTEHRPGC